MDKYIGRYNFNDKNVLVAGLGLSGTQVVRVLQEHDVPVITVDEKKDNADYQSFKDINWDLINLIIISPVFSPYEPWVQEALKRHIPIWSEIEFAWRDPAHGSGSSSYPDHSCPPAGFRSPGCPAGHAAGWIPLAHNHPAHRAPAPSDSPCYQHQ